MRCQHLAVAISALFLAAMPYAACGGTDPPSPAARVVAPQTIAKIVPGHSTKADVTALFGTPWRVVQFNDCGEAMDDQADETWEYRGSDQSGPFRLHIEFDQNGAVHLIAKIPENSPGGKGTVAKFAPSSPMSGMSM
jgi:hypothetical protein